MKKRWLICIDVPLWVSALGGNQVDWKKLLTLLDEVDKPENQLLFRNELMQLAGNTPDNMWLLFSKLSKMSTVGYLSDKGAAHVKSNPDATIEIDDASQKVEVVQQMAFLYKRDYSVPRPVNMTGRINTPKIVLSKDGKNPRKVYVCGIEKGDIQKVIKSLEPVLVQAKHFQFERNLGYGRVASPFSAYDKQNEEPAKALLKDAFNQYQGEELPANELWVKDVAHDCYVRFMHSGNNQYHGYDEKDLRKVPEELLGAAN